MSRALRAVRALLLHVLLRLKSCVFFSYQNRTHHAKILLNFVASSLWRVSFARKVNFSSFDGGNLTFINQFDETHHSFFQSKNFRLLHLHVWKSGTWKWISYHYSRFNWTKRVGAWWNRLYVGRIRWWNKLTSKDLVSLICLTSTGIALCVK